MVEPRIIETGDQVRGAGAGSCDADTQFARELGVSARHERRHFLVPRLDESDLVTRPIKRAKYAVDAVAGVTENPAHAPSTQALNNEVADSLAHDRAPSLKNELCNRTTASRRNGNKASKLSRFPMSALGSSRQIKPSARRTLPTAKTFA